MKVLQVIEGAYRCNLEEQDDPAVWITHAMKGAGAELHVLLSGNAVNYGVKAQRADGLKFGDKPQTQPPQLARDITSLMDKGVSVYFVRDDATERGLEGPELVEGLKPVPRTEVAKLYAEYDQIWAW